MPELPFIAIGNLEGVAADEPLAVVSADKLSEFEN